MTELEKIAYAKSFIDKLANGVNPIDGSKIPDGDVVNNVRLSRCLFYVSDILRQVIDNGGITTTLPVTQKSKKRPYYLLPEQADKFEFSSTPITASEIFRRILAVGPQEGVKPFPKRNLTKWLTALELVEEVHHEYRLKYKKPTSLGEEMGISLEERHGQNGVYYVMFYNIEAQHFIIDNIAAILNINNDKEANVSNFENQGHPWSKEQEETLISMFNQGASVSEMSDRLQRNGGGIRARLKRLGLIEHRGDI